MNKLSSKNNKDDNYCFEFKMCDCNFIISFNCKENMLIFDDLLKKRNKLDMKWEIIEQGKAQYRIKLEYFLKAINNSEIIYKLYKDSINIYL